MGAPTHPAWISSLLGSGKYTDFKISCQEELFHVHKAVVCTQSPVIAAAADGSFKESLTNTIYLDDFDVKIVKEMLDYLYMGETNSLFNPSANDQEMNAKLDPLIRLHAIADYLGIAGLGRDCMGSIESTFHMAWNVESFIATTTTMLNATQDSHVQRRLGYIAGHHAEALMKCDGFKSLDLPREFTLEMIQSIIRKNKASSSTPLKSTPTKRARRRVSENE
ncbi:hypothetical protein FQN53_000751 [Emmonsiellopsis sp. PD_33]|nr:hypothetical protein FQN53_000751 [Emmonsiellopsis sp. PD_33]